MTRQVFCQLEVKALVHRGHHALHQQTRDQVFGAYTQLFRQVFYADAFTNRDGARNGKRLIRQRQTRRWRKALHRAFFFPRNIGLAWTASRSARTRRSSRWWRRTAGAYSASAHSWARRITAGTRRTCWMRTAALFTGPALIRRP